MKKFLVKKEIEKVNIEKEENIEKNDDNKEGRRIFDKIKNIFKKYKTFEGINFKLRTFLVFLITFLIVVLSMGYNESNFVWDITRINEDVGVFAETSINDVLIDFGFTLSIILIVYGIIGNIKISMIISIIFWMFVNILNYILLDLRGTAFSFADIFSAGTGMSVLDGIKINISSKLIKYIVINILVILGLILIKFNKLDTKKKRVISRISNIVLSIILMIGLMNTPKFKRLNYWDLDTQYKDNGIQMVFIKQIDDFFLSKPKGYSIEKVNEILSRYEENDSLYNSEKTNVIVIMNESFADLKTTYNLKIEDNIPYFNSLTENTVRGTLYSSVLGGGTATAEWELLTGNSSVFLPAGAIPYIVYVRDDKETVVNNFRLAGYETVGMHSYYAKCYNRRTSYSKMGFDKGIFMDDMKGIWFSKSNHPSDESSYQKLIESYEASDKSKKFFGFLLTMQNHAPYTFEEYQNKGYYEEDKLVDQYLSLVNDSDKAFQNLIEYFKNEDEKVVILFLGDHQPKIATNLTQDEWLKTQKVPYLLWANFDIEEKEGEDISINYLSTLIYDYANLDTNEYIEFLKELKKDIPVYTAKGYKDKDGNTYKIDDETSPYYEKIKEYEILQYYFMFDK